MKAKRFYIFILIIANGIIWGTPLHVEAASIAESTSGKILLQVENQGEAWYVYPVDYRRYYLGRPDDAFAIMRLLGVGITNTDLESIPTSDQLWDGESTIMNHVRGKIMLQIESHGEAWYVNPSDGKRYYLGRPDDAWRIMTEFSLGISNQNLEHITIGVPGESVIADLVLLDVPFTAQAPYGNWTSPFDEACEEAILVMLNHYQAGTSLNAGQATTEILSLVDWETNTYSYHEDTSAEVTAQTARDYFGMSASVSHDVTADAIKQHLSEGKPVIVPVYGRALKNVHYNNGGPYYHMILLVGYEGDTFISHDPGTQYGKHYRYSSGVILNAIHDLTDPETNAASGEPALVVIE